MPNVTLNIGRNYFLLVGGLRWENMIEYKDSENDILQSTLAVITPYCI